MKKAKKRFLFLWIGAGLFFLLGLAVLLALPTGYRFSALVCFSGGGVLVVYGLLLLWKRRRPRPAKICLTVLSALLALFLVVVGVTEGLIIRASFGNTEEPVAYIVVLGAAVHGDSPSLSLQERINAAYTYLAAHPEAQAVLSGGQGSGENLSEARCMWNSLTAMGIPESQLWLEEQSTSTWENLQFSLALIEEYTGQRPEVLGIVSSEYHLFRAGLFADACGVEAVGIPAATGWVTLRINYFLREAAGVWHYILLGGQYT